MQCGVTDLQPSNDPLFPLPSPHSNPRAALQFNGVASLAMENVHVTDSSGYGLFVLNAAGNSSINSSKFLHNHWTSDSRTGGNTLFVYQQSNQILQHSHLSIFHSEFSYGKFTESLNIAYECLKESSMCNTEICGSGGLGVIVSHREEGDVTHYNLSISVSNCTFYGNEAYSGGNMMIKFLENAERSLKACKVFITDCNFSRGYVRKEGGGLYFSSSTNAQVDILISNSTFQENRAITNGGAIQCSGYISHLLVQQSLFIENIATASGGGVSIESSENSASVAGISFKNVTLVHNKAYKSGGGLYFSDQNDLICSMSLKVTGCNIVSNTAHVNGGGMKLDVKVHDKNMKSFVCAISITSTLFEGNYVSLQDGGHLYIQPETRITGKQLFEISSCVLTDGHAQVAGGAINVNTSALYGDGMSFHKAVLYIRMSYSTFSNNSGHIGGAIFIYYQRGVTKANFTHCVFNSNSGDYGGAIGMRTQTDHTAVITALSVKVENCIVSNNTAQEGAGLYFDELDWAIPTLVNITSTQFVSNRAYKTSTLRVVGSLKSQVVNVQIAASFFRDNNCWSESKDADTYINFNTAVLSIQNVRQCTITGTVFRDNTGSSIQANWSSISLARKVSFSGGKAYSGAAILLDCPHPSQLSFLDFLPNTTVVITNNTAWNYGGGIAVNPKCNYEQHCFFHAPCWNSSCSVQMERNTANITGNSLYAPSVDYCEPQINNEQNFLTLFNITEGLSANEVTLLNFEELYSICFCSNSSITGQIQYTLEVNKEAKSGQDIIVPVSVCSKPLTDISNTFFIQASLLDPTGVGHLGTRQKNQKITEPCENLTYSVLTIAENVQIKLSHDSFPSNHFTFINLKILPCSLGFQQEPDHKCGCNKFMKSKIPKITCNTTSDEILAPRNVWVGTNSDGSIVVHPHCPLDYCSEEDEHIINLLDQDQQCTLNRSGILCGECQTGLSLLLGTARCADHCTHYYLFLIIPFALAGVLLAFLLLKCNLTVSVGTTNTLILYANLIHINRTTFFPTKKTFATRFLAVFIAWLNLDLGIETCFYRGMNSYANIWLQFVFPVYIWLLVLIMIYSSRYSITASKLIGRNSTSVLATLFLLSYAKLLRTVIAAVSPINIEDENGGSSLVWLQDGNVPFLRGKHIALFIMALITVLLYIIPLTLLTLLAPFLQARTQYRMMRWVVRIKPLLDAYQGPFKDKYRYWTGVVLLLRVILFTVFGTNITGDPNINTFAITLSTFLLFAFQTYKTGVYKHYLNLILECFYTLNLGVFASGRLYLEGSQSNKDSQNGVQEFGLCDGWKCFSCLLCHHYLALLQIHLTQFIEWCRS